MWEYKIQRAKMSLVPTSVGRILFSHACLGGEAAPSLIFHTSYGCIFRGRGVLYVFSLYFFMDVGRGAFAIDNWRLSISVPIS